MNINILRYSLFGIAGGQEVDLNCYILLKKFFYQRNKSFCSADCLKDFW